MIFISVEMCSYSVFGAANQRVVSMEIGAGLAFVRRRSSRVFCSCPSVCEFLQRARRVFDRDVVGEHTLVDI